MQRTVAIHKYCCLCLSSNNMTIIPAEVRTQCYINKKIFIPPGNRCCKTHLIKNRIYEEDLKLLKTHSNTTKLTVSELFKVMETLSIKCVRTGNSNKMLASILNIENEQIISDYSASVVESFENEVLSGRFSLNSFDRANLIQNHTTEIAMNLFDAHNHLLLICDGTYARHQKSTNNEYQRKSFSGQKKVPLCWNIENHY